jgi:hypothetical protein
MSLQNDALPTLRGVMQSPLFYKEGWGDLPLGEHKISLIIAKTDPQFG